MLWRHNPRGIWHLGRLVRGVWDRGEMAQHRPLMALFHEAHIPPTCHVPRTLVYHAPRLQVRCPFDPDPISDDIPMQKYYQPMCQHIPQWLAREMWVAYG